MNKMGSAKWAKEAVMAEEQDRRANERPRCNEGCPAHAGGDHAGCGVAAYMMQLGEDY